MGEQSDCEFGLIFGPMGEQSVWTVKKALSELSGKMNLDYTDLHAWQNP